MIRKEIVVEIIRKLQEEEKDITLLKFKLLAGTFRS